MQSTEVWKEGQNLTREENLIYRRNCPYDAMGDYSLLMMEEKKKPEPFMRQIPPSRQHRILPVESMQLVAVNYTPGI